MKTITPGTLFRARTELQFFEYTISPGEVFMYVETNHPFAQKFLNKEGNIIHWVGCQDLEQFMNVNRYYIERIKL